MSDHHIWCFFRRGAEGSIAVGKDRSGGKTMRRARIADQIMEAFQPQRSENGADIEVWTKRQLVCLAEWRRASLGQSSCLRIPGGRSCGDHPRQQPERLCAWAQNAVVIRRSKG